MIFLSFFILNSTYSFEIQGLDPLYQVEHQQVKIDDNEFQAEKYFSYGIWSKYTPLSVIPQTGPVGLFDSNCYQLHHILEKKNNEINLIYYDCLDYEANKITKAIKFVNNEDEQREYVIEIEIFQYESFWYFLEVLQWPLQKRFEILIISQQQIVIHSIDEIKYPFKGVDLQFIFGSSLIVNSSRIKSILKGQKFSYFPGAIIIQKYKILDELAIIDWFEYVKTVFQNYEICECQPNRDQNIQDQNIDSQLTGQIISENQNCDSFGLSGWVKIKEIIHEDNQFIYPFIKLAANFEDQILTSDNLSPLQIQYQLSDIQNQIIVKTYSYIFPTVSINFSNNPFLLEKSFDITNSINLWHKIQIKLIKNLLDISIKFYEQSTIHEYGHQFEVRQFQQSQLKLVYGNIQLSKSNYLNIVIRNFLFLNCDQQFSEQNCHYSCYECDGPTNQNCLSCSEESKRIYLPEHKVCVCPYDTIDDEICISYKEADLEFIDEPLVENQCQYGYFELDNQCERCPSIITKDLITCLDCLQNPKSFSQKPQCEYDLYLSQSGQTEILQSSIPNQLLFDGSDIIVQHFSAYSSVSINDDQLLYSVFLENSIPVEFQCNFGDCLLDFSKNCQITYLSIIGEFCKLCFENYLLKDNICISLNQNSIEYNSCHAPYYKTFTHQCKLCPKKNCKYCFEYQNNEPSFKSTLYKNFENFDTDSMTEIGCAMCEDGFIFDFTKGECLRQQSRIQSCLRSFINLDGIELCTLSSSSDFSIAPEIINCEKYSPNCLQCVLTPKTKLQCVMCREGYTSSITTGNCYMSSYQINTIQVIQGDINEKDGYVQTIQSFLMQFLPDSYYYSYSFGQLDEFIIRCKSGYELIDYIYCKKYCSSECLNCKSGDQNFICTKCDLNYYRNPMRVQFEGQCLPCSNLCLYCEIRDQDKILDLQSDYYLQETQVCLKPVYNTNIVINPYLNNVKYCFNKSCHNHFLFSSYFTSCILDRSLGIHIDEQINLQYCNQVGVDQMTIDYVFDIGELSIGCQNLRKLNLWNGLKKKIFSLKKINMRVFSLDEMIYGSKYIINITNYDSVEFKNITFKLVNGFILENLNNKIDITLNNLKLIQGSLSNITIFQTQVYGNIVIKDVTILDSEFSNSTFFDFQNQSILISFKIQNLIMKNCLINNSTLLNIDYIKGMIIVENLIIDNCTLFNSSLFYLLTDLSQVNQIKLVNVEIYQCNFEYSSFLKANSKFEIIASNLYFHNNNLKKSVIIAFNDNLDLLRVRTSYNTLIESSIIQTLLLINQQKLVYTIDDFEDNSSTFQESSLIVIYSSLQVNMFIVSIKNIKVQKNNLVDNLSQQNQLFRFHCHQLIIQNAQFLNLRNLTVFYLYEINQIIFDSVIFENSQQEHKVPVSQFCGDQGKFWNQPIYITGFQQLSLANIKILNQFSINYSLMDIRFNPQFIIDTIGQVILVNAEFRGNILLKNEVAISLSLLYLYSEYNLNIKLEKFLFIQNMINLQIDEPLEKQTNLLHVSSLDSVIEIHDLYCYQNSLTNSTNPFITLAATSIIISDLIFMNSNFLPQTLWQQFYEFELEDQYNQQEVNSIIQQTFKILNQGIYVSASNFSCTDSIFQEIIAQKSSIFYIKTQGQGNIKISNLNINSVYSNLKGGEGLGCISIDSTNSLLIIDIKQIKFNKVFNRMAASLFTITTSLKQNFIRLNNIEIRNCFSLMNQIMQVKFSAQVMKQSVVSINKVSIYQSEELWFQFFSLIGSITISELGDMQNEDNAMIFFENCKVEIKNLHVEGIVISPIMNFLNTLKLKLSDCQLISIQKLYSFDLIHITQNLIIESKIYIQKLKIIKSHTYKLALEGILIFYELNYLIGGCKLWRSTSISEQITFSDMINQIQSSTDNSNSLMYVKSICDQNSLFLQQITIQDNDGSDFSKGMMVFEIEKFKIFKINDVICFQNRVKQNGCVYFLIQNFINSTLQIKDSYFIQNNGTLGGAIIIQNVILEMLNCKIISNYASQSGGGLFLQLKYSDFQIKSTIITNNKALNGGGIYFNQDGKILQYNFIKSFILFNKAIQFGGNLIESPHHLALFINNMEMQSYEQVINSIFNHHLLLKPFKIIEQGLPFITNYLMIPSNQAISGYQIYQPSNNQYFSYITSFGLILKNSLNEQVLNILNTTCIITKKTFYENSLNQVDELIDQQVLQFNLERDYYNLGLLSFILDPYTQEKILLQINVTCSSLQHQNSFNYIIQAKSFKCQLGEFYVNSGCQICSSNQGFYSVVYDATKCSIFDKTKFKNITENNIELLQGFWRPNFLSDQIEECFKNVKFCRGGWAFGNDICDLGHVGALCEECDIYNIRGGGKYFKNEQDSQCISCFGVGDSIIPFIAASIWSFISIIITLRSIEQSNQLFKCLKLKQRFSKIIFNLEQGHESFLIKMLLNYLWIFSVIFTFNIQFSFSFTFVNSASNTSHSMTNNLDCYLSDNQSIQLIYSKIITMLALMTFQFVLIIIGFLIYNFYKKIALSNFNLETISNTLLYLYVSNYGGLIKMYFSILSKREVSSQSYIQGDVSLLYGSREHLIWIFSFVIPGIGVFGVIIPLSLFIVMYLKKDQHDNIQIRKHFCYLINEYNSRSYFWEEIKLIKKTIIILILTYFETYILLKASLLGLCLLFYQLLAFNKKPYILSNFNSKDLSSAQICSITIFLAAAKYVAEQENNQFSSISLQTVIVLLCLKLCYSFIKSILQVYSNKYTFLILNYLHNILNKLSQNSILTKKLKHYILKQDQRNQRLKTLINKLRQHLLQVSKGQLEYQKIVNSQNKNTQPNWFEKHYK
ncbi:unnamed protein product [Paramecium octaurelia]|uniref:Transmembrane protein n=1 Tax=Paramecium octaurelia TaxID=43137 RepID=A0A8S1YN32_PAROT|nr:unnamed protein product [Paramecium octaurelia]